MGCKNIEHHVIEILSNKADFTITSFSPELLDEQNTAKNDKKRLRKVLRKFEDDFLSQTGR